MQRGIIIVDRVEKESHLAVNTIQKVDQAEEWNQNNQRQGSSQKPVEFV